MAACTFNTYVGISPFLFGSGFQSSWVVISGQNKICHQSMQSLPRVGWWALRELRNETILAHNRGTYWRNDSSKPRPLYISSHRNRFSVTLVTCKSPLPTTFPLLKNLIYPSFLPHLLRGGSLGYLRCCLLRLSPTFARNKTYFSAFMLCIFLKLTQPSHRTLKKMFFSAFQRGYFKTWLCKILLS